MHLALGRAGTDRAPRDEVRDVLRRDHVEELAAGRHAEFGDVGEQFARDAQAAVDLEAAVEIGIVDEALPADRRAGLLEVDAHHDLEIGAERAAVLEQAVCVVARRHRVMDRAGADDHDEAIVHAVQDPVDGLARTAHDIGRGRRAGKFAHQMGGRRDFGDRADAQVVGAVLHGMATSGEGSRR